MVNWEKNNASYLPQWDWDPFCKNEWKSGGVIRKVIRKLFRCILFLSLFLSLTMTTNAPICQCYRLLVSCDYHSPPSWRSYCGEDGGYTIIITIIELLNRIAKGLLNRFAKGWARTSSFHSNPRRHCEQVEMTSRKLQFSHYYYFYDTNY